MHAALEIICFGVPCVCAHTPKGCDHERIARAGGCYMQHLSANISDLENWIEKIGLKKSRVDMNLL